MREAQRSPYVGAGEREAGAQRFPDVDVRTSEFKEMQVDVQPQAFSRQGVGMPQYVSSSGVGYSMLPDCSDVHH